LADTNRALHDAVPPVDQASRTMALVTMQGVADRWDQAFDLPHLVLAFGAVQAHE
jgi:hypothetical protein